MKTYILIAAYNEEEIIDNVIKSIKKYGYKNIIVVDDGSKDKTSHIARKNRVITIRHIINRGKGAAIKTGIEAAKFLNADIVVTLDADGQHNPSDIKKMVNEIRNGYDVILGSRLLRPSEMPFLKLISNKISNIITWLIFGLMVNDSQCGLRAYSKRAYNLIDARNEGYGYDSEVIREILRNRLTFVEVPIKVHYTKYSMKKQNRQTYLNALKTMFKLILTS